VNLTLPAAATSIAGESPSSPAFTNFTALKTVSGAGVTTIGDYAFYNCYALTSVSFPAATSIGYCAFYNCTALTSVTLGATPPRLGLQILDIIVRTITVKIPNTTATKNAYGVPNLPTTNFNNSSSANSWGRAFKGTGWSGGTSYGTGTVNTNITLRFETY
jgi:hypothetical protein